MVIFILLLIFFAGWGFAEHYSDDDPYKNS